MALVQIVWYVFQKEKTKCNGIEWEYSVMALVHCVIETEQEKEGTVWWHWYKVWWHFLWMNRESTVWGHWYIVYKEKTVQCDGTDTGIWSTNEKKYSVRALVHFCVEFEQKKRSTVWWHWYKSAMALVYVWTESTVWGHWYIAYEKKRTVWWHCIEMWSTNEKSTVWGHWYIMC